MSQSWEASTGTKALFPPIAILPNPLIPNAIAPKDIFSHFQNATMLHVKYPQTCMPERKSVRLSLMCALLCSHDLGRFCQSEPSSFRPRGLSLESCRMLCPHCLTGCSQPEPPKQPEFKNGTFGHCCQLSTSLLTS